MARSKVAGPNSGAVEELFRRRFAEIAPAMRPEEASVEANRCLYCYDAPCIQACPTHIDIPRFIKQIASKNAAGSAKTILEANPMGHSCARVCPVEVLCEGSCVYLAWHEKPIEIGRLQRFATDAAYAAGRRPFKAGPATGRSVAVLGAGPSGLATAFYLRRLGHRVVVFEKQKVPGGLNSHGVAEYKMDQRTSLEEVRSIVDLGTELRAGVEIGKDVKVSELEKSFDAVFLGIGLGETNALRIPGEDLAGVWDALGFIWHIKRRDPRPLGQSSVTVVIGGGNTSIDAVTQSKRIGVPKVLMAYRRGRAEMSAYGFEFELAKSDEAEFLWHAAPVKILGSRRVEGVLFARTRIGEDGRLEATEETFEVACDRVIKAIGQTKHYGVAKAAGLELEKDGRVKVDPASLRCSRPRWWAGGDAVNGGKEVVNAAADGKRAAWSIHKTLSGKSVPPAGHDYWVSTIDGRKIAPITTRAPLPNPLPKVERERTNG